MKDVFQGIFFSKSSQVQNCQQLKKQSLNGKFPSNTDLYYPNVYWPAQINHWPLTTDLPQKLEKIILLCSFQPLIANTSAPLPTKSCAPWCPMAYALMFHTWGQLGNKRPCTGTSTPKQPITHIAGNNAVCLHLPNTWEQSMDSEASVAKYASLEWQH